jgi:hypothetical protein
VRPNIKNLISKRFHILNINTINKMMNKQTINIIMLALGFVLASNPYTNRMNSGLVRGLSWLLAGFFKKLP